MNSRIGLLKTLHLGSKAHVPSGGSTFHKVGLGFELVILSEQFSEHMAGGRGPARHDREERLQSILSQ